MTIMSEDTNKVGSLEEAALKRKERLKNLKRKNIDEALQSVGDKEALPKPKFRSYKPQDESLQENILAEAKPGNVEEEIKDQLEAANDKVVLEDLDIASLAPRKPDWDLKRDVAKKLEKLERKTQKAIAELIWEKLKAGQKDNIGALVNLANREQKEIDED